MPSLRSRSLPILAIALGLMVATAAPAAATTSRVRSLGGQGDYFEDDSNVLRWYGSLVDYADEVVLELGTWKQDAHLPAGLDRLSHQGGGVHLRFDEKGEWGTGAVYFGSDLPEPEPGGYFSALYARAFGAVNAGLFFRGTSYGKAANTAQTENFVGDALYFHDYGLGLRLDLGEAAYVDLAGEITQTRFEYDEFASGIAIKESSHDGGSLRARGFVRASERVVIVPMIDYMVDRRPTRMDVLADVADLDGWQVRVGGGANLLLDPDNLAVISVEYLDHRRDWTSRHPERALFDDGWRDTWQVRTQVGFESRVLPWLSLRAAARYVRQTDESYFRHDNPDGTFDVAYHWDVSVSTPVTLGLGLHFGAFDGDLVLFDKAPVGYDAIQAGSDELDRMNVSSFTLRYLF